MERTSFSSKFYRVAIRLKGIKGSLEKEFQRGEWNGSQKAAAMPQKVIMGCDIFYRDNTTKRTVWQLQKKGRKPEKYLLYLHGGAFVHNISTYDWPFLNRIVQHTDYGIIVPDYPLAPEYGYQDVYDMLVPLYKELLHDIGSKNLVLIGFSAGGGLTLSFAQYLKNMGQEQPAQIILLSPWLDATLQNPEITALDGKDPYLSVKGLKLSAKAYAKGDDLNNYMISPINGTLEGLAPMHLLIGTNEILLADARKLVALAESKNVHIDYHEYYKMYHAWIFLNMPEARDVFDQLINILK
ncbi:alpha/beta hydrolase [Pedobacter nutrimenti]|uniref:alpha/beta hydrolase n=1 Tax=Pedobacter nutrimenti TaxID=1241337 RepID=UPI00292D83E3|nr:alpha/beta hydrolase [Pedobacter nutrimenti]